MVVKLGLEGERAEGGGSEIPQQTSLLEEQARQSQQRRASALEAATAGELKTLEAALNRGESIGLLMDIFEQVRSEPWGDAISADGLTLGCPPQCVNEHHA